ncbi:MAG TPA: heavy metal-binding domain-containing protein [Myxococcaceae bacterium]|nr:heavy metal-binding domain-containing protein [Myxococcaceae bacterium]
MSTTVRQHKIPILTTFDAPTGTTLERVVGPCWGITVRSRSVVGQTCAGCQTFFGGEITALTELANDSRNEAMDRLETHALELGANAILGFRFDSGELMQNTNEIIAYGTAVVLRR